MFQTIVHYNVKVVKLMEYKLSLISPTRLKWRGIKKIQDYTLTFKLTKFVFSKSVAYLGFYCAQTCQCLSTFHLYKYIPKMHMQLSGGPTMFCSSSRHLHPTFPSGKAGGESLKIFNRPISQWTIKTWFGFLGPQIKTIVTKVSHTWLNVFCITVFV